MTGWAAQYDRVDGSETQGPDGATQEPDMATQEPDMATQGLDVATLGPDMSENTGPGRTR